MLLPQNPFSKTHHFGISINSTALRGLSVGGDGGLITTTEIPFAKPLTDDDLNRVDVISDALLKLRQQGKFTSAYVAVCIPEKYAFSREYVLPLLNLKEIDEAIWWQLEKIFPFQKDEIYYDWKLLTQDAQSTTVLITAIQRSFLDQLKDGFEKASLYPISFEPSASALARLVGKQSKQQLIIIELENSGTTSTLVINGISTLTTTTMFSRQTNPNTVYQDIVNSVSNLITKAQKDASAPNAIQIILTGEKANDQLAAFFSQSLKLNTQMLKVPNITPAYHLAYVAAISTVEPPASTQTINLLPTQLQAYYQAQLKHGNALAALKISLMSVAVSIILIGLSLAGIVSLNMILTRQIATESEKPLPGGPQGVNLAFVQQQSQRFIQLFPRKTTPENTLTTIYKIIPNGITINSLVYDATTQQYSLSGTAQSRAAMLALKEAIDDTKLFSKVTLPLSSLENSTNFNFQINFNVLPG